MVWLVLREVIGRSGRDEVGFCPAPGDAIGGGGVVLEALLEESGTTVPYTNFAVRRRRRDAVVRAQRVPSTRVDHARVAAAHLKGERRRLRVPQLKKTNVVNSYLIIFYIEINMTICFNSKCNSCFFSKK